MTEVIRHTSSLRQFSSFMESSSIFPQGIYASSSTQPTTSQKIVAATNLLPAMLEKEKQTETKPKSKRISRKQRHGRREKIPEGTLCVVCSDLASGIHYSVASCNGCKTFFRRALVNKQTFQCQFSNDCVVDKSVRCGCRSCRLKKCFQMGMDPNAIQHDRDKIRYTKRSKKMKDETSYEIGGFLNGKNIKEEGENSPQNVNTFDGVLASPSSSFAGQSGGPGSNGPYLDQDAQDTQAEMGNLLSDLLSLERKICTVRCANRFSPHTSAASCMFDRRLLEDEAWLLNYSIPMPAATKPVPCDRENLRAWFVKDLTLLIEWAKCIPQMGQLLINDKLALIKAFAPIYPLIQLACYSCNFEKSRQLVTGAKEKGVHTVTIAPTGLSMESFDADSNIATVERLWYPDGRYLEREDLDADFMYTNGKKILPINALLIDGVCQQILRLNLTESHITMYKIMLFFNPDADGLSAIARSTVGSERTKLLNYLYAQIIRDRAGKQATELYSNILMMTSTLTRVASFLKRTFDISHIFEPADDLINQLIIVGL